MIQLTDLGRGLRLVAQRQSEEPSLIWVATKSVCRTEPRSAIEAPLLMGVCGERPHHCSFILSLFTVGMALPLGALEVCK